MFLDLNNHTPRRGAEQPRPGRHTVLRGEEKFLIGILMLNFAAALIAVIVGTPVIHALVALFG